MLFYQLLIRNLYKRLESAESERNRKFIVKMIDKYKKQLAEVERRSTA